MPGFCGKIGPLRNSSEGRASLALGMSTLAEIFLECMGSGLLAVIAAVRRAWGDLAFARDVLAFFFFWHMDGMTQKIMQEPAEGRNAREYPSCQSY